MWEDVMGYSVHDWNAKIYRNADGSFIKGGLDSESLWDKFGIKSGPKFREACWSHIPPTWSDEVGEFITQVQTELGDLIAFKQIKEKFCMLTVYFSTKDEDARKRVYELQAECVAKLIKKGVHPPLQETEND